MFKPKKEENRSLAQRLSIFVTVLTAVIFTLTGLLFAASYLNVEKKTQAEYVAGNEAKYSSIMQNLFRTMSVIQNIVFSDEYYSYFRNGLGIKDIDSPFSTKQQLWYDLQSMDFSPDLIQGVLVIGSGVYNTSVFFNNGLSVDEGIFDSLCFEDLSYSQAISRLYQNNGIPAYLAEGELKTIVSPYLTHPLLDEDDRAALEALCEISDDEVLGCLLADSIAVVVIFNHEAIVGEMNQDADLCSVAIYDKAQRLIFTNDQQIDSRSHQTVKNITLSEFNITYEYQLVTAYRFSFKENGVLFGIIALFVVGMSAAACVVSRRISRAILRPFHDVTDFLYGNAHKPDDAVMTKIPLHMAGTHPLAQRILMGIMAVVVVSYILLIGVFYAVVYRFYMRGRDELLHLETNVVTTQIENNLQTYSGVVPYSLEDILKNIYSHNMTQTNPVINEKQIFKYNYSDFSGIKYIAVTDREGALKFQTSFIEDYDFTLSFIRELVVRSGQSSDKSVLLSYERDEYGIPGVVWSKPMWEKGVHNGYLLIFLNDSVFQSDFAKQVQYAVVNENDALIYDSDDLSPMVTDLNHNGDSTSVSRITLNQTSYLVHKGDMRIAGWQLFLLQRSDIVYRLLMDTTIFLVGMLLLVLLVSYLVSYRFSRGMARELIILNRNIEKTGNAFKHQDLYGVHNNEMVQLIVSYNRMIDRIESLTTEKIEQKNREQTLLFLKTQAELKVLQQKIDMHFLFNSLNIIGTQATKDNNVVIKDMVNTLAQLIRFEMNQSATVEIQEELQNIRRYVLFQKLRFGDKFSYEEKIDDEMLTCKVLRLIIQPLVENAFDHGIYECLFDAWVRLEIVKHENFIAIVVQDNGVGIETEDLARLSEFIRCAEVPEQAYAAKSSGIGLRNIYQRLKIYYNGQAQMDIDSAPGKGTTIRIAIPLYFDQE